MNKHQVVLCAFLALYGCAPRATAILGAECSTDTQCPSAELCGGSGRCVKIANSSMQISSITGTAPGGRIRDSIVVVGEGFVDVAAAQFAQESGEIVNLKISEATTSTLKLTLPSEGVGATSATLRLLSTTAGVARAEVSLLRGEQGPAGATGAPGEAGPAGQQGLMGLQGSPGIAPTGPMTITMTASAASPHITLVDTAAKPRIALQSAVDGWGIHLVADPLAELNEDDITLRATVVASGGIEATTLFSASAANGVRAQLFTFNDSISSFISRDEHRFAGSSTAVRTCGSFAVGTIYYDTSLPSSQGSSLCICDRISTGPDVYAWHAIHSLATACD